MPSINFNLKNQKDPTSLIIAYCYIGEPRPLRISTGIVIPAKFWNSKTQRVREVAEMQSAKLINTKLKDFKNFIEDYYLKVSKINREELRKEALRFLGKSEPHIPDSFFFFSDYYIKSFKGKRDMRAYNSTLRALKSHMKDQEISEIGYDYVERFVTLYSSSKIDRGPYKGSMPAKNTIGTKVKCIKAVLNYAKRRGMQTDPTLYNVKKQSEEIDSVYLTKEEIGSISSLELTGTEDVVRDLFLIGCYTALRISDFKYLKKENIKNNLCYKTTKKTTERVVIPLHPIVNKILEKYSYTLPDISDQKLNKHIKDIAQKAGITEPVTKTRTEGGIVKEKVYKKYELISSHTARRSGATNMFLAGIPTISIMMITGHRSEKTFMKYIRVTKEENAIILSNHPYFNET